MNKNILKNSLIALLVAITIFSVFKYLSSLKEKYGLLHSLNQVKEQVVALEKDKQNLLEELEKEKELEAELNTRAAELKGYLKAGKKRLSRLFMERAEAQKKIEDLSFKLVLVKAENLALVKQRTKLNTQLAQLTQESSGLKVKLSSITELKKAIKQLTKNKTKVYARLNQEVRAPLNIEGNRGFLIKGGKSTYPVKVRIEVAPATQVNNARHISPNRQE